MSTTSIQDYSKQIDDKKKSYPFTLTFCLTKISVSKHLWCSNSTNHHFSNTVLDLYCVIECKIQAKALSLDTLCRKAVRGAFFYQSSKMLATLKALANLDLILMLWHRKDCPCDAVSVLFICCDLYRSTQLECRERCLPYILILFS